jgi:hypothetical protein
MGFCEHGDEPLGPIKGLVSQLLKGDLVNSFQVLTAMSIKMAIFRGVVW